MMNTAKSAVNDATVDHAAVPQYGIRPIKPGLYLGLFHGRNHPLEEMHQWGFDGPTIGPLVFCHTTYSYDVKIKFQDSEDAIVYFGTAQVECSLTLNADMLAFRGKYYGDWTVYYIEPDGCARPKDTFRPNTRVNGMLAHRKHWL
jgi:hypothetical protein